MEVSFFFSSFSGFTSTQIMETIKPSYFFLIILRYRYTFFFIYLFYRLGNHILDCETLYLGLEKVQHLALKFITASCQTRAWTTPTMEKDKQKTTVQTSRARPNTSDLFLILIVTTPKLWRKIIKILVSPATALIYFRITVAIAFKLHKQGYSSMLLNNLKHPW